MRRPDEKPPGTGMLSPEDAQRYAQDVIRDSLTFLAKTGYSPELLGQICREVCERLEKPEAPFDPEVIPYLINLPRVLADWNSDPEFQDAAGQPLKIPLRSRASGRTLETLVRRVFPKEDPTRVVKSLLKVGAIRRQGRLYELLERFLILTRDAPAVHVHTMLAVAGMLRTVRHNIDADRTAPTLLERSARIPCIPIRALPEIHSRAKREFDAHMWKFDSYARAWAVEPGSEPTTCLGLGIYIYEDPPITRRGLKRASSAKVRTRTGSAPRRRGSKR